MLNLFQHPLPRDAARMEKWTLKQVQGDGSEADSHFSRSRFLYIESMRWVTAKPPKMFTLASPTATRPSHLELGLPAAALAISAPTTITEEMALVTLISGVCSAGVTDQTT